MTDERSLLRPFVVHVPHAATVIPSDLRDRFVLTEEELAKELLVMTDHFTDDLFNFSPANTVRFPVSRLVVDPERFADDAAEPMAAVGKGAVYERTHLGGVLRRLEPGERQALLDRFYEPHRRALEAAVETRLALWAMLGAGRPQLLAGSAATRAGPGPIAPADRSRHRRLAHAARPRRES